MILPNPYGPMTCHWILLGQIGFLINGTLYALYFPYCRGRIFHPLSKNFASWIDPKGQDQVASCSCRHVACMVFLPVNARCLNQPWPFARDWRCQLSVVLAKRRSTLRAGTESPGVPVAGNQSASKRLAIQDRMISKSSNKPKEPKATQTN